MCCWWSGSEGLGEAYDGDIAFASALETFGGGHDDPISVAVGGFPLAACFSLSYLPTCAYADPCIFISLLITTCDCTGPVMTKFTIALREIGTYKEVLRSQVVTAALLLRLCTSVWNAHSKSLILNSCVLWAISPMGNAGRAHAKWPSDTVCEHWSSRCQGVFLLSKRNYVKLWFPILVQSEPPTWVWWCI